MSVPKDIKDNVPGEGPYDKGWRDAMGANGCKSESRRCGCKSVPCICPPSSLHISHMVTKELTFDAAHRLLGYNGPCANLHGHTYKIQLTFSARELDKDGFVVDFSVMKQLISENILMHWDHATHLNSEDPLVGLFDEYNGKVRKGGEEMISFITYNGNPTAENMAEVLYTQIRGLLHDEHITSVYGLTNQPQIVKVVVWENPVSFATYA
jgi:6-pyruvoyltetrahydropterin/6-carboxytetrahydropterin synthase